MKWFRFRAGRDFFRGRGCHVSFGFWPRRHAPEGEIPWRWSGYASWDWLPPRIYERISRAPMAFDPWHELPSSRWTGREIAFRGFDWSRWYRPRWDFMYI